MLPLYVQLAAKFKDYQFAIAAAPSISTAFYKLFTENTSVKIISDTTYDLLQHSSAALVTSGTATLETALFQVPQIVCYKSSYLSYWIAKKILKLKYISLVNLILDREVVLELIQGKCNLKRLEKELNQLLISKDSALQEQYQKLTSLLGTGGVSNKTAALIYKALL
jgi:lipid-A-disaccharide synthase